MEALLKGSRVPKVKAVCSDCGSSFERSAVHPYIITCPECRAKSKKNKKDTAKSNKHCKCSFCKEIIKSTRSLGMHQCSKCKDQWWTNGDGKWRRWNDDAVFVGGIFVGTLGERSYDELYGESK